MNKFKDHLPDMFDAMGAREARDEALTRVRDNAGPWIDIALAHIVALPRGWQGTGEALRLLLLQGGCPDPHHHNAWGSVARIAIKRGWFERAGFTHMKTKKSHARLTPVWRRT